MARRSRYCVICDFSFGFFSLNGTSYSNNKIANQAITISMRFILIGGPYKLPPLCSPHSKWVRQQNLIHHGYKSYMCVFRVWRWHRWSSRWWVKNSSERPLQFFYCDDDNNCSLKLLTKEMKPKILSIASQECTVHCSVYSISSIDGLMRGGNPRYPADAIKVCSAVRCCSVPSIPSVHHICGV